MLEIRKRKNYRLFFSVFLVLAIVLGIFYAFPAQALEVSYTTLPSSGTLGANYSFTVQVDIPNTDRVPITSVKLEIYYAADDT